MCLYVCARATHTLSRLVLLLVIQLQDVATLVQTQAHVKLVHRHVCIFK